jgi:hypothetical protein
MGEADLGGGTELANGGEVFGGKEPKDDVRDGRLIDGG